VLEKKTSTRLTCEGDHENDRTAPPEHQGPASGGGSHVAGGPAVQTGHAAAPFTGQARRERFPAARGPAAGGPPPLL